MNNANTMTVETYRLVTRDGHPIRTATKVTDDKGRIIKFVDRLPKRDAIRMASDIWATAPHLNMQH